VLSFLTVFGAFLFVRETLLKGSDTVDQLREIWKIDVFSGREGEEVSDTHIDPYR
jgi:hypothetical protein